MWSRLYRWRSPASFLRWSRDCSADRARLVSANEGAVPVPRDNRDACADWIRLKPTNGDDFSPTVCQTHDIRSALFKYPMFTIFYAFLTYLLQSQRVRPCERELRSSCSEIDTSRHDFDIMWPFLDAA